jgi:hypothetical protein
MEVLEGNQATKEKAIHALFKDILGADKIINLWESATKMRKWFQTEKITIGEQVNNLFKDQAALECWDKNLLQAKTDAEEEKRWNDLISDIVNKSEFLLMMQTPVVFKSEPNEP